MNEPEVQPALLSEQRSLSSLWLIPLAALLIGAWMVYQHWSTQGPLVTLHFATATGIEAGKTRIKALSVDIGRVETVALNGALDGVVVKARLDKSASDLLHEDSQFWVVRPRIGTEGISGLDTLLSGAYIQLDPGSSEEYSREFTGLEAAPVTPPNTPGLRLTLLSESGGTLYVGDPVVYRGFRVGRVETTAFDPVSRTGRYGIFINSPYDQLVNSHSRFWNSSGINLDLSAEGFTLEADSLTTLLSGGVTFDDLPGRAGGSAIESDTLFRLYPNRNSTLEHPYRFGVDYLLLFDQSIRGLKVDAPVEYRGIRIGSVVSTSAIDLSTMDRDDDVRIPVLIRIEPGRMGLEDEPSAIDAVHIKVAKGVLNGLRATLKTGNLLTGSSYVDLDFYDDVKPAILDMKAGYATLPTMSDSLQQLQQKVLAVLDKVQKLQLEPVLTQAKASLDDSRQLLQRLDAATRSLDSLLRSPALIQAPEELNRTLTEARRTLRDLSADGPMQHELERTLKDFRDLMRRMEPVMQTLEQQPESLIFGKPPILDPVPEAKP